MAKPGKLKPGAQGGPLPAVPCAVEVIPLGACVLIDRPLWPGHGDGSWYQIVQRIGPPPYAIMMRHLPDGPFVRSWNDAPSATWQCHPGRLVYETAWPNRATPPSGFDRPIPDPIA